MKMKKTIASTIATAGLAAGLLFATAPAAPTTWVYPYSSHATCVGALSAKLGDYINRGYKVTGTEMCDKHQVGSNPPYYFASIQYWR